jgi:hypothetical protein
VAAGYRAGSSFLYPASGCVRRHGPIRRGWGAWSARSRCLPGSSVGGGTPGPLRLDGPVTWIVVRTSRCSARSRAPRSSSGEHASSAWAAPAPPGRSLSCPSDSPRWLLYRVDGGRELLRIPVGHRQRVRGAGASGRGPATEIARSTDEPTTVSSDTAGSMNPAAWRRVPVRCCCDHSPGAVPGRCIRLAAQVAGGG